MIAVSADDLATQKKFKASLEATFPFVADPGGKLIELYDVKTPVVTFANRTTFVIDQNRRIVSITTGGDAIDPTAALGAAASCGS